MVGGLASRLLTGKLDPRFQVGEVGLRVEAGELGGNLGSVDGLGSPRLEPDTIGPHPLTAEKPVGGHGVVADLDGTGANFLQTFLAECYAEDG